MTWVLKHLQNKLFDCLHKALNHMLSHLFFFFFLCVFLMFTFMLCIPQFESADGNVCGHGAIPLVRSIYWVLVR